MPRKDEKLFRGRWRLVETEVWDLADLHPSEPAYITFGTRQLGDFALLTIEADIDYRVSTRDDKPAVEFTWWGHDEGDEVFGRGWACIDGDSLVGRIFIHRGDESGFVARREED